MHGIPEVLHLDNASEFHSEALRRGCERYGIRSTIALPGMCIRAATSNAISVPSCVGYMASRGTKPESWVRGSASLDTDTGIISIKIQLESDSTVAGPKGYVIATAVDKDGIPLTTVKSDQIERGGKGPGKAEKHGITKGNSSISIQKDQAGKATKLHVEAKCNGFVHRVWNGKLDDVVKTVNTVVTAVQTAAEVL